MEDMLWKLPHIGERIFKKLSNKNLAKCKKVGRTWEHFIINDNFSMKRVKYELIQKKRDNNGRTLLHKVAEKGKFTHCKSIIDHVEDKNPMDNRKRTPLHIAAYKGHIEVVKLIFDVVKDKNPMENSGCTPLHAAAYGGHIEVFKLIFDAVGDKNPESFTELGKPMTPLDLAIIGDKLEIYQFIINNIQEEHQKMLYIYETHLKMATNLGHHQIINYIKSALSNMEK